MGGEYRFPVDFNVNNNRCSNTKRVRLNLLYSSSDITVAHGHNYIVEYGCSGQSYLYIYVEAHILVQVTIYRRLLIGRDGHLDQSEAYDIS